MKSYSCTATIFCIIHVLLSIAFAQIRIVQPQQLAEQFHPRGVVRGSTAAFGTPYWGEQLIGRLEYNVSKGNGYCRPDDYELAPLDEYSDNTNTLGHWPRIVVVRRGQCHFSEKVKVAQDSKGASAVIIVDEEGSPRTPSEIGAIIMADDGLGSKIRIPSVLISDSDGRRLIRVLETGQAVIAEMTWDLPNENVVTVDHWMSPGINTSIQFLQLFAPYARTLKYRMNFRPHYFLFSLPADANSMCLDTSAKFCSMSPDWQNTQITGQSVVEEIQRQTCLWLTTKTADVQETASGEYSEEWWYYVEKVSDRCLRPSSDSHSVPFSQDCSEDLMRELNIDVPKIHSCIDTIGTSELSNHLYNHAWSPTAMMINDARFAGPLDPFVVARAICTGFTLRSEPQECEELKTHHIHDMLFHRPEDVYIFGESLSYHKGGVAWWVYILSVLAALCGCIIVVITYRLWFVKQMRTELRYEVFEEVKSQLTDTIHTQHKECSSINNSSSSQYQDLPTTVSMLEYPMNIK